MKKSYYKIVFILLIFLSLFILTGCKDDLEELLNGKIDSEFEYIENVIFRIVKKYMSNEYLLEDRIDWDKIKEDFEGINKSSSVIITDLSLKNFEKDDILRFEELLNIINIRMEEENDISFLISLCEFYSLLPNYQYKYFEYNSEISIRLIKSLNLYSIISCMNGDFENAIKLLNQAENEYSNLLKDTEYLKDNAYYVNRLYVVLQEFKISLNENNLNLAIVKYLNTLGI